MKHNLLLILLIFSGLFAKAQIGLEDVIVEIYYISDQDDATDVLGGNLPVGSVTYRVFIDMAPEWKLQSIFGNPDHEMRIATTTQFFNNADWGEQVGREIRANRLNRNTVAVDSWITVGSASNGHWAVLKEEDTNGSVVGGPNNNGGSANIPGGLLKNNDPAMGIPLTVADGLIPGPGPDVTLVTDAPELWTILGTVNTSAVFSTYNSAFAVLGGTTGPTPSNRVLIAQITTDGELSFKFNIRIGNPNGGFEDYVSGSPIGNQYFYAGLCYPAVPVPGCTDATACNYDPLATEDDGSCLVPVENCLVCNDTNDGLILIDTDGDGICDADEVPGCTDPDAVNYNPLATDEDGSCQYEEFPGCINPTACNFDPLANIDDGSCIVPVPNCLECNATNDGLILIDTDGDGICDADEIPGCQSPSACNFDPLATDEDGSCLEPVENCFECNGTELVIIDSDGDGICDADEVPGCTNPEALNYNPEATDDDGSCQFLSTSSLRSDSGYTLFPNPTFGSARIKSKNADVKFVSIHVTNYIGETLLTSGHVSINVDDIIIDFNHLSSGTYFVEITTGTSRETIKVIKL